MIKANRGKTIVKGKSESGLIAEFMCIMTSISVCLIIPKFGRENLKTELYKIVDNVCESIMKESEE